MSVLLSQVLSGPQAAIGRSFVGVADIKQKIQTSKNYRLDGSSIDDAGALLLFSTSRQQTWLVATARRLYCVLDDLSKDEPLVQWSMGRDALLNPDGSFKITFDVRENTKNTGLIDIGDRYQEWLYSIALFQTRSVVEEIEALVKSRMRA